MRFTAVLAAGLLANSAAAKPLSLSLTSIAKTLLNDTASLISSLKKYGDATFP